ncbi:kinase-like domain-containing protein [Cokeromyces recurvatus]|uniref:kinase-like domain-containing protein n=1 Tax=Cokeromyces recurvatus TaxID=90255 RepID=UPI00221E9E9B|nr:kinase-like domain-containing protein [Cokeromyces recurvatus]KAI7903354.1 kinase-like domain-containing protein [Cokeromyces recurvatus]
MSSPSSPIPCSKDELPSIPGCDTIIDLLTLKGDDLKNKILKLVQVLFPDWAEEVHDIQLDRVSGAMTNAVFFVNANNKPRLLVRIYGNGVDQIIDRGNELAWLARLSHLNIGPSLLGIFGNGRFEEYLPSTTLTHRDLRDPKTSKQIASCLRELHDIVTVYPYDNSKLEIWNNIDKWHRLVMNLLPALLKKSDGWAKVLEEYNLERLASEIEECKKILESTHSPIVFAHNDTQYGNILRLEKSNELVIVDFEYAGYNPRGFDIANHFCEWTYDYHSDNPAEMKMDQFPTYEEQIRFLKAYLDTQSKHNNSNIIDNSLTPERLQKETSMWLMATHLSWGLWGLIQANQSEIDFDYFLYSMQRLNAFREELAKWRK